jgi:S-adenosylmethionine-dependent methyltransferase
MASDDVSRNFPFISQLSLHVKSIWDAGDSEEYRDEQSNADCWPIKSLFREGSSAPRIKAQARRMCQQVSTLLRNKKVLASLLSRYIGCRSLLLKRHYRLAIRYMYRKKDTKELAKKYDLLAEKYDERIHFNLGAEVRNRIVFRTLYKFIHRKPYRILDAGGGTGFYSIPLALKGHEITILDVSEKMLEKARESASKHGVSERVETVRGSMARLRFPESSFDVILCHLAFGYTEPSQTLSEFYRVLKHSGILFLTVANKYFYCIKESLRGDFSKVKEILGAEHFFEAPHGVPEIKTFTKSEIVNLCLDGNFEILCVKGIKVVTDYLSEIPRKTGRLKALEEELSEIEDLSPIARHIYLVCRKPCH